MRKTTKDSKRPDSTAQEAEQGGPPVLNFILPGCGLVGRAETAPELAHMHHIPKQHVESLIRHVAGRGLPTSLDQYDCAVTERTPETDVQRVQLDEARSIVESVQTGLVSSQKLRAFQLQLGDHSSWLRVNEQVQGFLTAKLAPDSTGGDRLTIQWIWSPASGDREPVATYTVLQANSENRSSAIVFWDLAAVVVRQSKPEELRAAIRQHLPSYDARIRWDKLMCGPSSGEVPSIYWETVKDSRDMARLASRVLERIERSDRKGAPSRRSGMTWTPLDEHGELEALGDDPRAETEAREEANALEQALASLDAPVLEVFRRHYLLGETQRQIGDSMGVSQQAISKTWMRAIAALRNRMPDWKL